MGLYISFNDSNSDPTYANADDVILVESNSNVDENPCVNNVVRSAPVLPITLEELKVFAKIHGWGLDFDSEGHAILNTWITE